MVYFTQWKIKKLTKKIKAMQANRLNNQVSDQDRNKEIQLYMDLADCYKKLKLNPKYPFAAIMVKECYRAAANLDEAKAHYELAKYFLDEAKYRTKVHNEGILTSQANLNRATHLYAETQAHLQAAEKLGHIEAKRLRGLCLINGWGVEVNQDAGFELVVASIEQEGSWDRVPQLFASIGLNKPEFFAAIMKRRKD